MLLALTAYGCSQSEESKPSPPAKETPAEKMAEATKTAVGEVKEAAEAMADKAVEMEKKAEPAVKEAAEDVKEEMAEAKKATEEAVEAAKQSISPETIVFEASFGNVIFPHLMHSSTFECSTCHGVGTPGLFGLDKDKAHALCKGCHQEKGAGPTACTGCHQK